VDLAIFAPLVQDGVTNGAIIGGGAVVLIVLFILAIVLGQQFHR
jgi:hypothetical protein